MRSTRIADADRKRRTCTSALLLIAASGSATRAQPAGPTEPAGEGAPSPETPATGSATGQPEGPSPASPLAPRPPLPPPQAPVTAPAPATNTPPALAVAYDKGVSFDSADGAFGLRLSFRNQVRFESLRATEAGSQFESRFSVPRARVQAEGHVFGANTRYRLEVALGDLGSFAFVRDLVIDQRLVDAVWFRAGQWKRPFNRQDLVSDFASELNERAITSTFVGGGRDIGVGLHNEHERSPEGFEWALGVFNGFAGGADRPNVTTLCTPTTSDDIACVNPPPTTLPVDFGPTAVVRLGLNVGDIRGYSEGDLEGGPFRLAIGASYKIDLANLSRRGEDSVADNLSHGAEADLMLKVHGFALEGGVYLMKIKSADAELAYLAQAGQFLVARRVQLAARFAYAPTGARNLLEVRGAFNVYFQGHAWKWATDVGLLELTGQDPTTLLRDKPDYQVRSMLQLVL